MAHGPEVEVGGGPGEAGRDCRTIEEALPFYPRGDRRGATSPPFPGTWRGAGAAGWRCSRCRRPTACYSDLFTACSGNQGRRGWP